MSQTVVNVRIFLTPARLIPLVKWFLFFQLIVLSRPSVGQVTSYSYTKRDTILAIRRLFELKRMGGQIITAVGVPLAVGGAGVGLLAGAVSAIFSFGRTKNSILPVTLLYSSIGLAPTGLGIGRLTRYSRRREDALIDAYESGGPLPAFVRRNLRPRYFEFPVHAPGSPSMSGR